MSKPDELAVFGGEKTVTASGPRWPYFTDEEIEAVHQCLLRSRTDGRDACTAAGGGTAGKLEERFAESLGRRHAVYPRNGVTAIRNGAKTQDAQQRDSLFRSPENRCTGGHSPSGRSTRSCGGHQSGKLTRFPPCSRATPARRRASDSTSANVASAAAANATPALMLK